MGHCHFLSFLSLGLLKNTLLLRNGSTREIRGGKEVRNRTGMKPDTICHAGLEKWSWDAWGHGGQSCGGCCESGSSSELPLLSLSYF